MAAVAAASARLPGLLRALDALAATVRTEAADPGDAPTAASPGSQRGARL